MIPVLFEELDFRNTHLGELSLRRRGIPSLGGKIVYEVKLGDAFLMSSLFTEAECAVARLGLAKLEGEGPYDVVVGGLGLGYTAMTALEDPAVRTVLVIEALTPVIEWHQRGLVPAGERLTGDPRCRLEGADFFALAADPDTGFDASRPGRRFHAVLLDIDHSPGFLLHENHGAFYRPDGLRRLAEHLHPGGVFALWADGAPDPEFLGFLHSAFARVQAEEIRFQNPLQGEESSSSVYLGCKD